MADMSNVDPNFEPQSRPRSCTWPLNRPNIELKGNKNMGAGAMNLGATMEESNPQEMLGDSGVNLDQIQGNDDFLTLMSPTSMITQSDLDSVLIGSPMANLVTDFTALSTPMVKEEPGTMNTNMMSEYCSSTTITELSNLEQSQCYDGGQRLHQQSLGNRPNQITPTTSSYVTSSGSLSISSTPSTTVSTASTGATPKAKSTRKNAWGNMSYADLITQAIESSPDQRLTLAQVYEWMVKNVPYFKDKGDSNSSAGWKNSIRHNLSLHSKFKRIQNEGTGKSSWWVINHDAKPGKSPRRRTTSMDNASTKYSRSKQIKAKQKAELLKKKSVMKGSGSGTWGRDPGVLENPISKALGSDYRPRASSSASSISGRISPRLFLSPDLEDDGAPPLSPLSGSNSNLANLNTPVASAVFNNIFEIVRQDNSQTIPEGVSTDLLLEDLKRMDVESSPVSYTQHDQNVDSKEMSLGLYMHPNGTSTQLSSVKNMSSNIAQASPNLTNLLQQGSGTPKKVHQQTNSQNNIKIETQHYGMDTTHKVAPYPYDYQTQDQNPTLQSPPEYKPSMQSQTNNGKGLYSYCAPQQNTVDSQVFGRCSLQQANQPGTYIQQQGGITQYMIDPQQQQQMQNQLTMDNQRQANQYVTPSSNLLQMNQAKFPSDINLDGQELFDSGDLDLNEMLQDIPSSTLSSAYNFNLDFDPRGTNFYPGSCQQPGDYGMPVEDSSNMLDRMINQPAVMQSNQDAFLGSPNTGISNGMGMMMENTRTGTQVRFQQAQANRTSIGPTSRYELQ